MGSFSATIGCRVYHVYRNSVWSNIAVNQIVEVHKENNALAFIRSVLLQNNCKGKSTILVQSLLGIYQERYPDLYISSYKKEEV